MTPEPARERRGPLWTVARAVVEAYFRGLLAARRFGLENVPRSGPVIVAANHVSVLDGPLAALVIDDVRRPFFMGKQELFRIPVLGAVLKGIGAIPLDRSRGDVGALRKAEERLAAGGCLLLFPEGTRSRTGRLGRPKLGVAYLAQRTGACVVPARVFGTAGRPRRGAVAVAFGRPMRFSAGGPELKADYRRFADDVMTEISKLEPGT